MRRITGHAAGHLATAVAGHLDTSLEEVVDFRVPEEGGVADGIHEWT